MPGMASDRLARMVEATTENMDVHLISDADHLPDLRNQKLIFAVELNRAGYNLEILDILSRLYERGEDALAGSQAVILIHSPSQLYTKEFAQSIIFTANLLGCRFPGAPLVEATRGLENFKVVQKKYQLSLEETCLLLCRKLGENFSKENPALIDNPKIIALHASSKQTSNTLMLWNMIKSHLTGYQIEEFHVENGTIVDCGGCSYHTCKHYSESKSCFYGGPVVQEILPAIEKADVLIWLCPNYNDAISAKLMAVINRLTVLYRRTKFYQKTIFAVIVSGVSGCDSVAKQLIGALNINKSFRLPPRFAIMARANDAGEIKKAARIEEEARKFAQHITREIKA